jgi:hypothetical protein
MITPQRFDALKQITETNEPITGGLIRKFYIALQGEISSLVKGHREAFEAKMRDFDKKRSEYWEASQKAIDWVAVDAAIKKATETREDEQEGRRVHCTTDLENPPQDGWTLVETEIPKDGLLFSWDFWAPPDFLDNPVGWFDIYKPDNYDGLGQVFHMFFPKSACRSEDELLRDYVVLTVLYNKRAEEHGETPIEPDILSGIEIPMVCESLLEKQIWPKVRDSLMDALEVVNNDLASTKRNAAPAKGWKMRAWDWVKKHPHSYGLTSGFIFMIIFFVLGLFKIQWRNWCWGTGAFAFLVLILSLLGGRSSSQQ